jgi:hypothetical protein
VTSNATKQVTQMIGATRKMYSKSPYGLKTISDVWTTPAPAATDNSSLQLSTLAPPVVSAMQASLRRIAVKFQDARGTTRPLASSFLFASFAVRTSTGVRGGEGDQVWR